MSKVIINPGSGPVQSGTREQSEINIKAFIKDLRVENIQYEFIKALTDGRHLYKIRNEKNSHEIEMPALPLEKVRYLDSENQDIFNFPRLYVDGSSWVWKYALNVCFNQDDE
jgi:hypothetical protein